MKREVRVLAVVLLGVVASLAVASMRADVAVAASGNAVLEDCNAHGALTRNYTLQELRHAQAIMPATFKEYGNCPDAIQAAITEVKSGHLIVPKNDSSSSFLPTPVIVILVLLILAALTFGALALRRRRSGPGGGPDDGEPPAGAGPTPPPAAPAA